MSEFRRPRYYAGKDKETGKDSWVYQESHDIPSGMTLNEISGYARENGIPRDARFEVTEEYGDHNVSLTWLVPVPDDRG